MKQQSPFLLANLVLLFLSNCVSAPPTASQPNPDNTRSIAMGKLDGPVRCIRNTRGDLDVCYKDQKQVDVPSVSFVVVSALDGSLIMDVMTVKGSVEWHDDTHLKIQHHPGYIPQDDNPASTFYLYDVLERKRVDGIR